MGDDITGGMETGQEIAVIGMAARFPHARNIDEFWENLKNGVESIYYYSDEELLEAGIDPGLLTHPNYVKTYGCLEDIEYFDASFFGYTPKEAEIMDPQVRIFHECVWTALEHAGYDSQAYDGLIGLYAGATANMNWGARVVLSGKSNEIGSFTAGQLIQKDYLSIRISYKLNLMGPSFVLSTACSTSLVAIHVACQAILNGECDIALAGGITVAGISKSGYLYQEKMIFSPDGHCRAFDAAAKGFVSGDGAGIVVLKRLEDAYLDRDNIYAVIKGSALNNDGIRKAGFTASSVEGQAEVIKMALQVAEVEPESISYIETHGTGTELGDPVEIEGLKLAYNTNKKGFCAIGSVKTNMGHLDSAAGVASFIKTLLALMHRQIPPSLHFEIPNSQVDFINSPFYINTGLTQWTNEKYPLRAGVSSFGVGGTNAHVILEEPPEGTRGLAPMSNGQHQLIILSAKTESALERMRQNLAEYFKKDLLNRGNHENPTNPGPTLADAAYTLQVGRKAFEHRWMTVSPTLDETIKMLASPGAGETHRVLPGEEGFDRVKPEAAEDKDSLLQIGRLWLHGHNLDWKGLYSQEHRFRISLPTYPFERQRYWIEDDVVNIGAESLKQNSQPNHQQVMSDWFYLPTWKRTILEHQNNNNSSMNLKWRWLVFVNELPLGKLLVRQLKEKQQNVMVVKKGEAFGRGDDGVYTVNPRESRDYDALFEQLRAEDALPDKIVHCWNVTANEDGGSIVNGESFDAAQYLGFYSLLYTAKTLGKQTFIHGIHIAVLSNHVQEVIGGEPLHPEKSTVLGLLKSIPQEYPGIRCRGIDICLPEGEGIHNAALIDALLAEFTINSTDTTIAYRNNQRWVQMFDPLHLEQPREEQMRLRKNGVYLVTGGLGNIGLMFSELLVKHTGARLVLTSRSDFPSREEWNQWLKTHDESDPTALKIKKMQKLEEIGGKVLYLQADAGDLEQMRNVIIRTEETFGTINGVIHSAGIIEGESMRSIQELSKEDCRAQFQAKVYGTIVLEELFKEKELDFCWLLSSISCVLGGLGFGAYASANVFMDVFVKRHNQLNGSPWFSLNWDGMEADKSIAIFKRMFPLKKTDQLVVSNGGNLHERIDKWIKLETLKEKKSTAETISNLYPRPDLSTPYVAPGNTNEETIANIWQELLGYDKIGVHDDFLELGGDSLKSITLLSRIHQELNINVPLTEFFTRSTIREFAEYILAHSTNDEKSIYHPIKSVEKKEYYPASSAQARLYVMQQTKTDDISYNMSYVKVIDDEFDENRLLESFRKLIRRHESLRTSFEIVKEKVVQRIDPGAAFDIEYFEIGTGENQDAEEKRKEIDGIITRFIRPFDLSTAPLLRIGVIKIEGENPLMIVDMHHIISDGISLHIIVKDFMMFYTGKDLPGLMFQYKDYSQWQNSKKTRLAIKRQEEYWLKEFEGEIPELLLPYDYPRPAKQSFEGDMVNFTFEENTLGRLKELAVKEDATFFMVLIAIYNIFLAKLTGQEDIVIGTGVAGRRHDELRQLIGLFVNTLALRNFPKGEKTFKAFLKEVKEKTLGAFENQDYPLEELVEKVVKNRSSSRNPLFDAVIVSQNVEVEKGSSYNWDSPGLNIKPYYYVNKISKFDISLLCTRIGDKLVMGVEYCTKLFKKETIDEFIGYFNEIVTHVLENKDIKLMDIAISHDILSAASVNPEMELAFLD